MAGTAVRVYAVVVAALLVVALGGVGGLVLSAVRADASSAVGADDLVPEPVTDENGIVTATASVRDVLETFYLGRSQVIWTDDLPCSDVRAYALPADTLVAWCIGATGQPYMTQAGADEAWNDLAEADRRNWIASAFALRRLIVGGITEDDAGTVWREYRWT
jgi:hypothetical protein